MLPAHSPELHLVVAARRTAIDLANDMVNAVAASPDGRSWLTLEVLADGVSPEVAEEHAVRLMVTSSALVMALEMAETAWERPLALHRPMGPDGVRCWQVVLLDDATEPTS